MLTKSQMPRQQKAKIHFHGDSNHLLLSLRVYSSNIFFINLCASSTPALRRVSNLVIIKKRRRRKKEWGIQSCGVGRHSSSQSRSESWEESLQSTVTVHRPDGTSNGRSAFSTLHPRLDGINREHRNPHGDTGGTTSSQHSRHGQFARDVPPLILRSQAAFDVFVGGKVRGGSGTVTRQGHGTTTENTAQTTLLVQLFNDVQSAGVFRLLAGWRRVLALDLEENLDTLEGGGDQGHGDRGEETGGGDLVDGELGSVVFDAHLRKAADDCFTQVVTPEANSDCTGTTLARLASTTGNRLTHRSNTNKRRRNTSIQSLDFVNYRCSHTLAAN